LNDSGYESSVQNESIALNHSGCKSSCLNESSTESSSLGNFDKARNNVISPYFGNIREESLRNSMLNFNPILNMSLIIHLIIIILFLTNFLL
jgi:hypothetical protein